MQMTVNDAINELESRKAFLMQSCVGCGGNQIHGQISKARMVLGTERNEDWQV